MTQPPASICSFPHNLPRPLHDRGLALAATIQIGRTGDTARIFAAAGYDTLVIDGEHNLFPADAVTGLCLIALEGGMLPIMRLPDEAPGPIRQALSAGAMGVMVARVETPETASAIVRATRFPPEGSRPVPPVFPQFGRQPFGQAAAIEALAVRTVVIVLIETSAGLDRVQEIAAVPGVDVVFLGLSDLSTDLGIAGQKDDTRLWAAATRVCAACKAAGVRAGIGGLVTPEQFTRAIAEQFSYVSAAHDATLLATAAAERAHKLRRLLICNQN